MQKKSKLQRDEDGAALVEYGLLIGFIAAVAVAALTTIGANVGGIFTSLAGKIAAMIP